MVYYNVMVNIAMCYSNPAVINMYWYYRKLVYKIIVNGGGYRITYFVAGYWIYSIYISSWCMYGRSNILFIQKSSEFVQCDAFYMSKSGFVKLF